MENGRRDRVRRDDNAPVSRSEFNELCDQLFILERTVNGLQQMLGKAAEYQGKPRGRLPR